VTAGEQLSRLAERLSDRLLVVGPRMEARGSAEADALLAAVRVVLQRLADLAADAEHRARRPVPELPGRSLGDQLLVLAHDVADLDEVTVAAGTDLLEELRAAI